MKSLTPNKTRSQAQVALNSGFFWSDNQVIEFEKRTVKNGIPFIEQYKGIVLYPTPDHEEKPKYNLTKCFPIKKLEKVTSGYADANILSNLFNLNKNQRQQLANDLVKENLK